MYICLYVGELTHKKEKMALTPPATYDFSHPLFVKEHKIQEYINFYYNASSKTLERTSSKLIYIIYIYNMKQIYI